MSKVNSIDTDGNFNSRVDLVRYVFFCHISINRTRAKLTNGKE